MNHIAIKMLMGDRGKYLGIVMGLTFASLIMTQQPAIFFGADVALLQFHIGCRFARYLGDGRESPVRR